ncbi:hypothetical protein HPP92_008793 [Vanilla planifolia]|uniref:G domain-containing protein n=1 Tax=Vanilla planifolia TaxID=51239 RepID=A0A835V6R6_VANPL|nr:hypothetical protein HPP92_008793 [Vanilla planifolia]
MFGWEVPQCLTNLNRRCPSFQLFLYGQYGILFRLVYKPWQSLSKWEAEERLTEGFKRLEDVFELEKSAVDDLLYIAKTLRAMPVVNLEIPTLCLVGAPNVGKSSLVRILSTGKPEVCNYPFTTRGILMGHIVQNYERFQVTDTPGLLKRHDDDRNNLEKLTLAVLAHLPNAILYVHDLTGECGTSAADQFVTYMDIKRRFGHHLWLDVVSKVDLLQEPGVVGIGKTMTMKRTMLQDTKHLDQMEPYGFL